MSWKKTTAIAIPALALTIGASSGARAANLVLDGDFESTSNGTDKQFDFSSQTQSTAVVNNLNHGFAGWMYQTFDFKAANTSEMLSFFAVGTPNGLPPFVLLDGVSVNATVPEPSALSLKAALCSVWASQGSGAVANR